MASEIIGTPMFHKDMVNLLNTTRQTVSKHEKEMQFNFSIKGKMVRLPRVAFSEMFCDMEELSYRQRETVFKVFYYLALNCGTYGSFSRSQKQMAQELKMDYAKLNEVLQLFYDWGWFIMKERGYHNYRTGQGKSSVYIFGEKLAEKIVALK